uniref:Ig-like domain-containing protein n=1 Tax=Sphaeramia orbicularis TaxID=375764 RepID=A0A673BYH4_9TELE
VDVWLMYLLQPGDQCFQPGDTVTLKCSLGSGFDMSSYTMFWYRQGVYGAPLEFLTKEHDQSVGRIQSSIDGSKNSFTIQISELLLNDSSTYYCAASHSDANGPESRTNRNLTWLGLLLHTTLMQ